jgi:hypothetical protein
MGHLAKKYSLKPQARQTIIVFSIAFAAFLISIVFWNTLFATRRGRMLPEICLELRAGTNVLRGILQPDLYACRVGALPVPTRGKGGGDASAVLHLVEKVHINRAGLPVQIIEVPESGYFSLDVGDLNYSEVEVAITIRTNGYIRIFRGI